MFLCHHEQKWLEECSSHFRPYSFHRYVDDILTTFTTYEQAIPFLSYLNTLHPNINFTIEHECNNKISFLDIQVDKSNETLNTSVYRKPSTTLLGLHFFSFCPIRYKINSIKTLLHRAYALSSTYLTLHSEINYLTDYFSSNSFPLKLIEKHIRIFINAKINPPQQISTVPKLPIYIRFPYQGYTSYKISNDIRKLTRKLFPQIQLNLIFTNKHTISSLFKHKERLPASLCSSLVYQFTCEECNSSYIGSTTRHFRTRIDEHRGVSTRTSLPLSKPTHSEIRQHCESHGHPIHYKHFTIIDTCNTPDDLRILESLHIHFSRPNLNSYTSAHPLHIF